MYICRSRNCKSKELQYQRLYAQKLNVKGYRPRNYNFGIHTQKQSVSLDIGPEINYFCRLEIIPFILQFYVYVLYTLHENMQMLNKLFLLLLLMITIINKIINYMYNAYTWFDTDPGITVIFIPVMTHAITNHCNINKRIIRIYKLHLMTIRCKLNYCIVLLNILFLKKRICTFYIQRNHLILRKSMPDDVVITWLCLHYRIHDIT